MAARETRLTIHNATKFTLTQLRSWVCDGKETPSLPLPASIPSGTMVVWQTESDTFMQGTEGWAKFQASPIEKAGDIVTIYWDNPFVGNTFFGFAATQFDTVDPAQQWGGCKDGATLSSSGGGGGGGSSFNIQQQPPTPPRPSLLSFFATVKVIDNNQLVGVTQGDLGDESGGDTITILPFPGQDNLFAHAWFEIGIGESEVSLLRLMRCLNLNPAQGVKALVPKSVASFSVKEVLNLKY